MGGATGRRAGGDFSGSDIEDGLTALCRLCFWFDRFEIRGWWRGWRYGEEGAFVGFGVADEGGDVVVGEERVGEDFRRRESGDKLANNRLGVDSMRRTGGSQSLGMSSLFVRDD